MSIVFLVLSIIVITVWIYFLWSRRRFYKLYFQLRGPLGLPFIGIGLQMMKPEGFLQYMQQKGQQYKTPFVSWMGTKCFLYVNDPETIETIFNSACCTNKGDLYRFMATAIGDGLFTSSSPRWNKHRRLINPAFSRQVIHTFLPIFNQEANILVTKLMTTQCQPLEIYEILKRSVLETACQTTMGKKINFKNNCAAGIFESYNGITEVCVKRMLSPWLYSDKVYRYSSLFKRQRQYINVLYEFVENLLEVKQNCYTSPSTLTTANAVKKMPTERKMRRNENKVKSNLQYFYECDKEKGVKDEEIGRINKLKSRVFVNQVKQNIEEGQLTWQDVRDEANVIVAATFETTSTALYLVCLCLAMHPEYQEKLYNELVEIFPTNNRKTTHNSEKKGLQVSPNQLRNGGNNDLILTEITLEHLERMTYAEMVINEAMRLFAPVPMVLRQASCDFQLCNGTIIPEGTQIGIDIFNMQRSEQVWGTHATTFNPDKHFATTHKPHPFAFIPFTKGLRMCIGYRYALILMKIMLAKIFRNFLIHTDAKMSDLIIKGTISLKLCQYPLCMLQKRTSYNDDKIN
ncbi:probable cytochrome P450 313b1 [Lucilia cuprina]|uniref:probable cytochrome P450 313b1 n=1 Tax=Lucilia cuprina TaxID=7375 RepID=UPI001F052DB1|nr:probable cytochrome P450 313b1 [Lucilia cuprina]